MSRIHSNFSLIQPPVFKVVQLADFDKTSDAWQCIEVMIVWGTVNVGNSMAKACILRAWVQSPSKCLCGAFNFLTNLTNLTNLLSLNLKRNSIV